MNHRKGLVPSVYLILEQKGKTLLGLRCYDGFFQFFNGRVGEGELPSEAAVRELKERLGVNTEPKYLRLVHVQYLVGDDDAGDRVNFFFRVEKWKGEPQNVGLHECDDLQWFNRSQLPENIVAHVREAMFCINRECPLTELLVEKLKELRPCKL